MKTKAFLFLCLFLGIGLTQLSAQMKVLKTTEVQNACNFYIPCTGDYICGDITIEIYQMANNSVYRFKKMESLGYTDEACTIPSGKVYQSSETFIGLENMENTAIFRCDGKNIGTFKFMMRTNTNANGEVKVEIFRLNFICH